MAEPISNSGSVMDAMMAAADSDDSRDDIDVIIAGELVTYTARLVGEASSKPSKERGWLAAMTSANSKTDEPANIRLQNVRTIAKEAVLRNVLTQEQVNNQLSRLGISLTQENAATERTTQKKPYPTMDYKNIGNELSLDENSLRKPNEYIAPGVTNMFADSDTPTLGGRMVAHIYDQLIKRKDATPYKSGEINQLLEISKRSREDFVQIVEKINTQRKQQNLAPLDMDIGRKSGTDGFHFNGDVRPSQDFLFYFNKSKSNYKRNEPDIRAYVSIKREEREKIQQHFTELSMRLYDAGIDFSAKAASIFGVTQRTDNMVFYISVSDQPKANEIIKQFLQEKGIGESKVMAAIPSSSQEGLSWAMQPNEAQMNIWKKASGSSVDGSFNTFVAVMAMPAYLDRTAQLHRKKGDIASAEEFESEAKRIRAVIETTT